MFKRKDRVVVVGDLHFPYVHPKALKWAYKVIEQMQPTHIIQIGDLYDFFWFSKYPKRFLDLSPDQEISVGYAKAESFWNKLHSIAPKAKKYQLRGNHDDRPYKRILEKFPEMQTMFKFDELFQFEGVKTQPDSRQELILTINKKQVMFIHGHLSQLGAHMNYNQMRIVVGHSHKGGVVSRGLDKETLWELNCAFLGDAEAGPLQYGPQSRRHWTLGLGAIDEFGPRFMPFEG